MSNTVEHLLVLTRNQLAADAGSEYPRTLWDLPDMGNHDPEANPHTAWYLRWHVNATVNQWQDVKIDKLSALYDALLAIDAHIALGDPNTKHRISTVHPSAVLMRLIYGQSACLSYKNWQSLPTPRVSWLDLVEWSAHPAVLTLEERHAFSEKRISKMLQGPYERGKPFDQITKLWQKVWQ